MSTSLTHFCQVVSGRRTKSANALKSLRKGAAAYTAFLDGASGLRYVENEEPKGISDRATFTFLGRDFFRNFFALCLSARFSILASFFALIMTGFQSKVPAQSEA
jgi:hypothetical protein